MKPWQGAKLNRETYEPEILQNGDTLKQLFAQRRYLLFKHQSKWTLSQLERANLLLSATQNWIRPTNYRFYWAKFLLTVE
jgi:hypothetical protein